MIDSDEESEVIVVSAKTKSGPKSKKSTAAIESQADEQLLVNLPKCSVVLKADDVSKEMKRITRSTKRKAQLANLSENGGVDGGGDGGESTEKGTVTDDHNTSEPKRQKFDNNNTDKTITTKSKKCHICEKSFQSISVHYANVHESIEVHSARMSPENSDKVRKIPPKLAVCEQSKVSTYCYYCEKDLKIERYKWILHLIKHTGEYNRICLKCDIIVTSKTEKTPDCYHTDIKYVSKIEFTDTLFVFMCNLCNYTQYQEDNLKNHIRNMHDINFNVDNQYKKITLIPNFRSGRGRRNQRQLSTTSEPESVATSEEFVNQDVFKTSSKDDDVLSESFKLMKENSFSNLAQTESPNTETIADRLNARFKKQQENSASVKEEIIDSHDVVYRSADELLAITQAAKKSSETPLIIDGGVIEDGCKIELNKTEATTSGIQSIDVDDTDENWESCSEEADDDDDEDDLTPTKHFNTLNRLILRTQKTNKRVKTKKRTIFSALKMEKLDEDSEKEIKTENSTPTKTSQLSIRPVQDGQKRIDNIAYSEFLSAQKFNCFIGNCDFLAVNNSRALQTHLRTKHGTDRWNGTCYACDKQIFIGNHSLLKEFDHMIECHVPNTNVPLNRVIKVGITPKPQTIQKISSTPQVIPRLITPKPQIAPKPQKPIEPTRPLIKIRRLSGDMLSGVPPMFATKTMPFQISNVPTMPVIQQQNFASDENVTDQFENQLKPWTKCLNTKTATAESRLKRDCSLIALFKCMANDCIFTTSDKDKMLEHLSNHEDFLVQQASYSKHHSNQDDSSWLECCYCEEIPGSCSTLVDHIVNEHSTSIFQCPFCFYRSADKHNVSSHLKYYHKEQQEGDSYILICGSETVNLSTEINELLSARTDRVKMIKCPENGKFT